MVSLVPSVAAYVYGSGNLLENARAAADEVDYVRPDILILHGGPSQLRAHLQAAIDFVRRAHPFARVWAGIGWDGTAKQWREGERSADAVLDPLVRAADICHRWGVEGIVHNAEAGWKDSTKDKVSAANIQSLAARVAEECTRAAPNAVHFMSSYDHLSLHGDIGPFMRGALPRMSGFTGQGYIAVPGGAPRGALDRRLESGARSQELAERAGYLLDDKVGVAETAEDLDRVWTVQWYSTHPADLAAVIVRESHSFGWSLPSLADGGRSDVQGLLAARFAMVVRAAGFTSIAAWQEARGLKPDGIVGPKSLQAAGVVPFAPSRRPR